jgi:hypothetical protein
MYLFKRVQVRKRSYRSRTKEIGHKWNLEVWNIEKPQKMKHIPFYSKKDAIFAIKGIKEYDDTLKVNLIKVY